MDGELAPADLRSGSQLGSPVTLRVLAGVWYEFRKESGDLDDIEAFFGR
jgi:hypothetical protein